MENKIKIAVVNFNAKWGDKAYNLKSILEYCVRAGEQGVNMIVFPETALSGYDDEAGKPRGEKMHCRLAEAIPGPSTEAVAELAQKYDMFVIFGMPEKDGELVYNSAAIVYPDGKTESYRKIQLPFDEANWAVRGENPVLIDTKWGPVGITICYDTYCFPELIRYYRSMGARLCLNVTACPDAPCTAGSAQLTIPAYAMVNYVYIASANLCGKDLQSNFIGGSSVVGIREDGGGAETYIGKMFGDEGSTEIGMKIGEVDLALADTYAQIPIYRFNDKIGDRDWRADLYARLYLESKAGFDAALKK